MPIILGIIAVIALVGGGIFFFSAEDATAPTDTETEEAARIDSEEVTQNPPADEEEDSAVKVEIESETEIETSALDTSVELETNTEAAATKKTYTASAGYLTPSRTPLELTVNLTVAADGTITGSDVIYEGGAGYSNGHQERFDQAYSSQVNGKTISEINLSRVGGASLTSAAFNEAVTKIEAQRS